MVSANRTNETNTENPIASENVASSSKSNDAPPPASIKVVAAEDSLELRFQSVTIKPATDKPPTDEPTNSQPPPNEVVEKPVEQNDVFDEWLEDDAPPPLVKHTGRFESTFYDEDDE